MKECLRCFRCWDDSVDVCLNDGGPLDTAFEGPAILDGKYRLDVRLGHGGMGVVYRAHHLGLHKTFAVKLMMKARDQATLARFRVEAAALGKLKHPNIVEVTDFGVDGRDGGLPYLVMEYLEGTALPDRYRGVGRLPLDRALPIFESIADAIDHAHARGILHLDLKPGNIFVSGHEPGRETVKILDFGLARFVGDRPTADQHGAGDDRHLPLTQPQMKQIADAETRIVDWHVAPAGAQVESAVEPPHEAAGAQAPHFLGTVPYMAPEVLSGRGATRASDIYSFGVLIYEVLVGRTPYQGSSAEILAAHRSTQPPTPSGLNPALPADLDEALLPGLDRVPAQRPQRAVDVVGRIRSAMLRVQARTWRTREIPRRVGLAAAAAVVLPIALAPALRLEVLQQLENRSVDARFASVPKRGPDPRLMLVSLDEASLAADPTPLTEKADDFGRQLERVFEAGARGVAVDFLLPETWSRSKAFSELILRHPDTLTLAAFSSPSGVVIGPECLSGLTAAALGPSRASGLFAFVNLDEDEDGVNRHAQLSYLDRSGQERDGWARRAVRSLEESSRLAPSNDREALVKEPTPRFSIDHSVDWQRLKRVSWKDLASTVEREPEVFRDRLVLVGGDFVGFGGDYHRVPRRADTPPGVSGLVLQALIANTIISGFPVRELGRAPYLVGLGVAVAALTLTVLLSTRWLTPVLLLVLFTAAYAGASWFLFRRSQILLPMAGPLLTTAVAILVASILRLVLPRFPEYRTAP